MSVEQKIIKSESFILMLGFTRLVANRYKDGTLTLEVKGGGPETILYWGSEDTKALHEFLILLNGNTL